MLAAWKGTALSTIATSANKSTVAALTATTIVSALAATMRE
jgi:hypothetical protein